MLIGDTSNKKYVTNSNYARRIKLYTKGEDLKQRPEVLTIPKEHTALWSYSIPVKDDKFHHILIDAVDFFNTEKYLYRDGKLLRIPIPKSSEILTAYEDTFIISLKEDLKDLNLSSGDLASIKITNEGTFSNIKPLLKVKEGQAIQSANSTKNHLIFTIRENVSKKAYKFNLETKKLEPLLLQPEVSVMDSDPNSNTAFLTQADFLSANKLVAYNLKKDKFETLQKEMEYFDSNLYTYSQDWAVSEDGTRVPFYIVHRKDLEKNGKNPTIMYGYGGFEISLSPFYLKNRVPEWVSTGGVFVLSNIRGGGEFGPEWHKAAQKFNKKKSYEDFAAIAKRLFELKITSSNNLGIVGGSNGGLLVGASSVLYPDLYKAAFCAVPLLDMLRYDKLLVGASWISEYGDPKIKKERDYIKTYSPFQNVEKEGSYPTIFFYTSTFDDRVHPAHARKMYKKMIDQGHKAYYYENSEGGHAGSADLEQRALMDALKFTFFRALLKS
jgi:prolyl oligopeptidase